ncbi:MAG: response regulator [Alphaproteobacteria bacterium]|nr:response regulator [Alphaproteobacteria bacterium]MBU2272181.1 response regulator [Alphaproteobacteria bacterium]MBU2419388.1 response regulator [Alphaproteobacteria bacterium]
MGVIGETLRESAIINLTGAVTMVVDDSAFASEITCSALLGFGIKTRYSMRGAAEAIQVLKDVEIDLLVVDCEMPGMDGFELVHWLRRSGPPNAFVPVIMTAGHIRRAMVTRGRDCGANFIITKPFSAASLLERIIWVARDGRPFLEVGEYFGPDRRFRDAAPPGEERRSEVIRRAKFEADKAAGAAGPPR